jgi:hypothetical protein
MKLTVFAILMTLSFSSFSFTPDNVQCLKDAKKSGMKMEEAYQSCSLIKSHSSKKKK